MIGGLVLAAGGGARFGGAKQVARLDRRPLLEHVLAAMSAAPLDHVVVVLGFEADAVLTAVDLHGAEPVACDTWRRGQSASLRAGFESLAGVDAVVVALGDQPFISPAAVQRLTAARGGGAQAVRATYGGVPGHPILIERSLFPAIARLEGDVGAREVLAAARVLDVPCDGLGRPDDVDTPEALRAAVGVVTATRDAEEAMRR
jgi:molybdenum cofactor cytidylyltransferase